MSKQVIVLTGVPGVGKTTVAEILAERIGGTHIDVSDLAVREGLIVEWDKKRETAIADIGKVRKRLTEIRNTSEEPLIVEGHFASDVTPRSAASFIFVLRRAPWRLKEELTSRGYSKDKVRENVEAELVGACLNDAIEAYGVERICEVDTTDRTPRDVAEELLSIIKGDKACSRGLIDWLGHEESKTLLEAL